MPAGIGIGQILGLVREMRGLDEAEPIVVISGPGAEAMAAALAEGGDRSAIAVDGYPAAAAVALMIIEGDPDERERVALRRLVKEQTPVIVVRRRGGSGRLPHVLADDVVELGSDDSGADDIGAVARAIAGAAGTLGPPLAARLPVLQAPVSRRLVARTAFANAAIAASSRVVPQLPVLTLAQARMLLLLGVTRGESLPRDPEGLLRAAGPYLIAALGAGVGARSVVRRLPVRGPIVRAAFAFGATRALGTAVRRL